MKTRIALYLAAAFAMQAPAAQNVTSCTEMVDAANGKPLVREGQCDLRVPPMSTFKIAISLMGFDSGVLTDEHTPTLPFKDGYVDWRPEWKMPTDPANWMKKSVVWYSQQVTTRLGEERYERYVKSFGYGNQDVSGDPDEHNGLAYAWLGSSLRITPDEQIAFLTKVVNRKLAVSANSYDMTAHILQQPVAINGWDIYGKTGMGSAVLPDGSKDKTRTLGWFVGWATKGQRTIVFARMAQAKREEIGPAAVRVKDGLLRDLAAQLESL
jgi:beta-lactamase class D